MNRTASAANTKSIFMKKIQVLDHWVHGRAQQVVVSEIKEKTEINRLKCLQVFDESVYRGFENGLVERFDLEAHNGSKFKYYDGELVCVLIDNLPPFFK
jgi:hypothetical protein